jgi:hypothetical protein
MSMDSSHDALLKELLEGMSVLRKENQQLAATVDSINGRVNMLAGVKQLQDEASKAPTNGVSSEGKAKTADADESVEAVSQQYEQAPVQVETSQRRTSFSKTSKIILTSYPNQSGVDPLPMQWGAKDPVVRGPVVVSRHPSTIRRRNGMYLSLYLLASIANCYQPSVLMAGPTPFTTRLQ